MVVAHQHRMVPIPIRQLPQEPIRPPTLELTIEPQMEQIAVRELSHQQALARKQVAIRRQRHNLVLVVHSPTRQVLANQAAETTTERSGSGYSAGYGVDYKGQGTYQNYTVPVSDVGILQSIIRTYFYLNDVQVTLDPNNPAIEAIVNINVDVFGSIRSRLDTVIYNKETVKVQTVLEVMAIDFRTKALMMVPQTGSYEASYDEKYAFWIGPLNKRTKRITHGSMEDPMLVSFADVAQAKLERDRLALTLPNPSDADNQSQRLSPEQNELENIQQTLSNWLKSWEDRNVAEYLSFYSPSFVPKEGMSLERWKSQRTTKLTNSESITIMLKNAQIVISPDKMRTKITFLQEIMSSGYNDTSIKTLELEKIAGQWKITKEESVKQ